MGILSSALVVSALATASAPSHESASLSFVSKQQALVGTVYGIDAIDSEPRAYGNRLTANVLAGRRTVAYSCPSGGPASMESRISFDFVAGQRYELVCQAATGAVIRPADGC